MDGLGLTRTAAVLAAALMVSAFADFAFRIGDDDSMTKALRVVYEPPWAARGKAPAARDRGRWISLFTR